MKDTLFFCYATFNSWILSKLKNFTENLTLCVVHASHAIYSFIDKDRVKHLRSTLEQQDLIDELKVFSSIDEIKDDAISVGEWNEDHEAQLNWFGNILYNHYDWEVEEVHRYLTEVIERASSTMAKD
jgi:hypothetical protein